MFDTPITTNDLSVDRVLAAGLPVLFVFLNGTAPTALKQTMDQQARLHAGELLLAQVQINDNPQTARRYQVNRGPTLVAVRNDEIVTKAEAISSEELVSHTAYLLGEGPRPQAARSATVGSAPPEHTQAGFHHPNAAGDQPLTASDASFEADVLRSPLPVLVDFWAPWCGPCRMTEPILEKLAREMSGRLRVVKVNVDENPTTAGRYGVRSIPTMMMVKDGRTVDQWSGALPEGMLRMRVNPFVA